MLTILTIAVFTSIFVSAICSLMEAALYAVPLAYVHRLAESGSRRGKILLRFKEDMGDPIAAILILNTVAHTAGAAVSGWAAGIIFGEKWLVAFSVILTLAILYLSEILPKLVGVVYCKEVSGFLAFPLLFIVKIFKPLIWVSQGISRRVQQDGHGPKISHEEMVTMADIGTEEGSLDHLEGSVISNVIGLDEILVRDALTPRVVVFRLDIDSKIAEVADSVHDWTFSRVPLFSEDDPEHLTHYVIQRDVYRELLQGNQNASLRSIARELPTVPELMQVDRLLLLMFENRYHICSVVNEHGSLVGIISLEDIIEEIVGREIVDEFDTVSDLRTYARIVGATRTRKRENSSDEKSEDK